MSKSTDASGGGKTKSFKESGKYHSVPAPQTLWEKMVGAMVSKTG